MYSLVEMCTICSCSSIIRDFSDFEFSIINISKTRNIFGLLGSCTLSTVTQINAQILDFRLTIYACVQFLGRYFLANTKEMREIPSSELALLWWNWITVEWVSLSPRPAIGSPRKAPIIHRRVCIFPWLLRHFSSRIRTSMTIFFFFFFSFDSLQVAE